MNRLLVVVDYQNDFVDGALGFKGAELISHNIAELIKEFRNKGDEVVFTYDTHDEDYLNTVEGKNLPVPHCFKGSDGWQLYPEINALLGDAKVFYKSGFGSKELGDYIASKNYDEIYLVGLVSDICVFSNAIVAKASASPYTKIKVVRNATSSFDLEMQEKSFDVLKHLHIEII
jgi:nicotinamidase-related amidase